MLAFSLVSWLQNYRKSFSVLKTREAARLNRDKAMINTKIGLGHSDEQICCNNTVWADNSARDGVRDSCQHSCANIHGCAYMHTCKHTWMCIHAYMQTHMDVHTCIHANIHGCAYMQTYIDMQATRSRKRLVNYNRETLDIVTNGDNWHLT